MKILRQRIETRPCSCGHPDLLHMGLWGKCLASLGNGSNADRRLSDLCCEVDGGCRSFTAPNTTTPTTAATPTDSSPALPSLPLLPLDTATPTTGGTP